MNIFNNCRTCLREINHEPIKMTRLILKFFEESLMLTNVTKPISQDNLKPNLCAPCFNKISEFQDFLEQCKESDEFWKLQFMDTKENIFQKQLFDESALLPLLEDGNGLEADTTTVTTTEVEKPLYTPPIDKECENQDHSVNVEMVQTLQLNEEKTIIPAADITEDSETQIEEDFNSIDLVDWQHGANDGEGDERENEIDVHSTKRENEDFIEYEIGEDEEVEIDEIATIDESLSSDACGVDYRSFAYEKIEVSKTDEYDIIDEPTDDNTEEQSEPTKNTFFLTTSIDENGKIKMSYQCPMCDKSFHRIYDIESHYNIHNGIKPFTCNVCGKSFRQKNILTTHQALHFGKKVECTQCEKKFARRSQLILHYRMHRDEKPFECNVDGCHAAFRQRKQLIDHSFIHSDEKNFQCATCSKSFHTRKRLQDHLYKVHSQHRYRCELCEKAFLKPHMLKHHMVTVHNVEVDDVSHLKTSVDVLKPFKK